ncbi:MAG: amidohydrolase [Desulfatitalea sp.]|nr:amidohydrolase [Desulfatitalea sp.]
MPDLTIALIQTALAWEDIDANLAGLTAKIESIAASTDLIVLPEMFSTGFSMNAPRLAEPMTGKAVAWLRRMAAAGGATVTGSLMIEDSGHYYNRLLWARPDGSIEYYDKKHLFRYAGEEKVFTAGTRHMTWTLKGWRIRPFICYDLRFPVWTRNLSQAYDLALFVANWPARRAMHWQTLLRARAIENQAYVIGVNRVGTDGKGLAYDGCSAVIAPTGEVLLEEIQNERICTLSLERGLLESYRKEFPVWRDADKEMVLQQ